MALDQEVKTIREALEILARQSPLFFLKLAGLCDGGPVKNGETFLVGERSSLSGDGLPWSKMLEAGPPVKTGLATW